MKTVCKASFFHLICIFFSFRIMERIAKNTKPTIQALGRACKKYPKTLPLFISILKKLYISKNISSSPNSDLPVSFTAAKSIISCISIQSNKKDGPQKIRDGIFRALAGLVDGGRLWLVAADAAGEFKTPPARRDEGFTPLRGYTSSAPYGGTCLPAGRSVRGSDRPPACHSTPRTPQGEG